MLPASASYVAVRLVPSYFLLTTGSHLLYNSSQHAHHGWIFAKVASIEYKSAHEGGTTFMLEAPQIEGELETGRAQLFLKMPER